MADRARILVVDDEPDIVGAMAAFLEGALPVQVVQAGSGAEGLQKLDAEGPIDLVISDYRMPGMNGLDFLKQVRAKQPDVPRLLLTAFPDMQLAIQALNDAHIVRFLTKPVQPDQLAELVAKLVGETRRTRQAQAALRRSANLSPGGGPGNT